MSSGFAPSTSAAQTALGAANTISTKLHPAGAKGAAVSLNECANLIREGRNDPRVRAWAGEVLIAAGKPKDPTAQAQAILNEFRRLTQYIPDPVGTEMMVAAKNTLCLDKHGLCIRVRDCDDGVVALGSAYMSIGIPVHVLGQAFNGDQVPTHVLLEIDTPGGWKAVEPSHDTWPVGQKYPASREWRVDPMDEHSSAKVEGIAGDFVGVGLVPGTYGPVTPAPETVWTLLGKFAVGATVGGVAMYSVLMLAPHAREALAAHRARKHFSPSRK